MVTVQAPEIFQHPIASLKARGLPPAGSDGFKDAVVSHFALEYASRGWTAIVTVDEEFVRVVAIPENGIDPKRYVLGLLKNGFLEDALPILEALSRMMDDAEISYNYGICLSELGRPDSAIQALERCVAIDPSYAHAYVGLGVAYTRLGKTADAERALARALALAPHDVYAKRNLAAVLAGSGKLEAALPLFRELASISPDDPTLQLGLAQCLEQLGGDHRKEADQSYADIMLRFPTHPAAEAATKGRNRIASEDLHAPVDGNIRMDAVLYMQGALARFSNRTKQEIGEIVMEIAILGQKGLKINDPSVRYTLTKLPGDYSGLQLMAIMHTGLRMLDPAIDPGTGLDREYAMAISLQGPQSA